MHKRSKDIWIKNVTAFESNWRNDPRLHLLHPRDVTTINQWFSQLKHNIRLQPYTKTNQKNFSSMWFYIVDLVSKANERMETISSFLLDMIDDK
jgi:hypothetical protein